MSIPLSLLLKAKPDSLLLNNIRLLPWIFKWYQREIEIVKLAKVGKYIEL
jgi:hypothetical protein